MDTWRDSNKIMDVIQEAMNDDPESRGILTKFVAVCEVASDDGKRLVYLRGPNADACPLWDAQGLAGFLASDDNAFGGED